MWGMYNYWFAKWEMVIKAFQLDPYEVCPTIGLVNLNGSKFHSKERSSILRGIQAKLNQMPYPTQPILRGIQAKLNQIPLTTTAILRVVPSPTTAILRVTTMP